MMEFVDKLYKLNRDLTGLGGLLYDMSNSADRGGMINEGELMLLAEIAYRGADVIENILQNDDSDNCRNNTSGDEWREELLKIYERLYLFGRAEVLVHADKVEKKALEQKS